MDKNRLFFLVDRVNKGLATLDELAEYDAYLNRLTASQGEWNDDALGSEEETREELRAMLITHIAPKPIRYIRQWVRIGTAATLFIGLTYMGYFLFHKPAQRLQIVKQKDIAPGGNIAILTLSNGSQIVLNGKTGQIARQAGKQILINASGQISYRGITNSSEPLAYNTLTVPVGNRRDLVLPDGTEVSLDAGSSITYPVVFKSERRVSMTGQAYFKVKHDAAHPFYTTVKGVTIKDIGTEFNINAYDDEAVVRTTLVKGSIKVNEALLKPGQQAQIKDGSFKIKQADIDAVTAWKDNDFYFDNQSLKSSMRQIARWYNVKVVYNNVDEKLQLFIDVTRATNLSVVLKAIENTGKLKCSLEGNTVTLSKSN